MVVQVLHVEIQYLSSETIVACLIRPCSAEASAKAQYAGLLFFLKNLYN
jgi:hypothetical protein